MRRAAASAAPAPMRRWVELGSLSSHVGAVPYKCPTRWMSSTLPSSSGAQAVAASVLLDQVKNGDSTAQAGPSPPVDAQRPPRATATVDTAPRRPGRGDDTVSLETVEEVEAAFRCSVEARTVSNAQLRRYIQGLQPKDYSLALAAVSGAKRGGLKPNAQVYESLLGLLIEGGQLRASMELYQSMVNQLRMNPTPQTYAVLMELCLQRDMPDSCQRLFNDMRKRGMQPSPLTYDLMLTSLAAENPPKWEQAIEIFDKLSRDRRKCVTARTYNALMRVYMNMEPFDWRVVYNAYHEMRSREPRIPLEWESYLLLREALRRGNAGKLRRFMAYLDAWVQTTPLWSVGFLQGLLVYFAVMWVIKTIIGYAFVWYVEATGSAPGAGGTIGESMLPSM